MNPLAVPSSGLWNIGGAPVPPGNASLIAPAPAPTPPPTGVMPGAVGQLLGGFQQVVNGALPQILNGGQQFLSAGVQGTQAVLNGVGSGLNQGLRILFGGP
jgi:hypothetical protein